jgi:ribose transport system substrate-binding protein
MHNRRRLIVGGVGLALALAVAGSLSLTAGARSNKTIRIAYFAPLANTYVQGELRGIAGVLKKEKGVQVVKVDTGFDASKQFNSVQDAITQKSFDGFIVLPLDSVGLVPAVQQAIKAGIKVVNADTPLGPSQEKQNPQVPGESGSVFDPWTKRGRWTGQLIVKACKGLNPCKVGWVSSVAALPAEKAYKAKAMGWIARFPNIKVVGDLDGGAYTAAGGQKVSQDMLTAHPDINVLNMVGDQPAAGAVISVASAGLTGKVKILGGAVSDISKPLIQQGKVWGSWAAYPEDEGTLAIQILLKAIRGQLKKPVGVSPAEVRAKQGQSFLITKANVGKFKPQYAG